MKLLRYLILQSNTCILGKFKFRGRWKPDGDGLWQSRVSLTAQQVKNPLTVLET